MKTLGYIRVSSQEQSPDRQIDSLSDLCDHTYIERISAVSTKRPVFERVLDELEAGDVLMILDLDRAFRSVVDALQILDQLHARDIGLRIVNMNLDTTTPGGVLIYTILSAFAAFERQMLSQRTKEGLAAARRRGVDLGRPSKLSPGDIATARWRIENEGHKIVDVARDYGMAPWSLSRALKRHADLI